MLQVQERFHPTTNCPPHCNRPLTNHLKGGRPAATRRRRSSPPPRRSFAAAVRPPPEPALRPAPARPGDPRPGIVPRPGAPPRCRQPRPRAAPRPGPPRSRPSMGREKWTGTGSENWTPFGLGFRAGGKGRDRARARDASAVAAHRDRGSPPGRDGRGRAGARPAPPGPSSSPTAPPTAGPSAYPTPRGNRKPRTPGSAAERTVPEPAPSCFAAPKAGKNPRPPARTAGVRRLLPPFRTADPPVAPGTTPPAPVPGPGGRRWNPVPPCLRAEAVFSLPSGPTATGRPPSFGGVPVEPEEEARSAGRKRARRPATGTKGPETARAGGALR